MWGTPRYSPPRGAIGGQPKVDDEGRHKLEPKLHGDRIPSIALFIRFIRYLGAEQAASGDAQDCGVFENRWPTPVWWSVGHWLELEFKLIHFRLGDSAARASSREQCGARPLF